MKTAKKKVAPRASREIGTSFSAEETNLTPLLPQNLLTPESYRQEWASRDLRTVFRKARLLVTEDSSIISTLHYTRLCYFDDGLKFTGPEAKTLATWADDRGVMPGWERLSLDAWTEWLMQDNVIAFWVMTNDGTLPTVVILDCEMCRYSNKLGHESLRVKPVRCKLDDATKAALGERWAKAYETGKEIEIDPKQGERFKVLTWAKMGSGLGMPRLRTVFQQLGTLDLLLGADAVGAWEHRNVTEHWQLGHEIKQGPMAGSSKHFITKEKREMVEKGARKIGGRRAVTNFDAILSYKFLDPAFFDAAKYKGVMDQLKVWGGAPAAMIESGAISPVFMQAFANEGRKLRKMVGGFLASILNHPDYYGGAKPPAPIRLGWSASSFRSPKDMLELIRLAGGSALMSPQTQRQELELDNQVEGDLLKEAHKDPDSYRPVFEAKQGMSTAPGGDGRPPAESV